MPTRTNNILFPLLLIIALLSGCTARYVAEYDASVKEEIVQVAKKVDLFWGNLLDTPVPTLGAASAIERIKTVVTEGGNTFAILMDVAKDCTLGQITQALYDVVGRYRRRV